MADRRMADNSGRQIMKFHQMTDAACPCQIAIAHLKESVDACKPSLMRP